MPTGATDVDGWIPRRAALIGRFMRLAHARPATVTLMAGSVLLAASGASLTVAASTAAASTATTASGESCEPLQLPAAPASPSPSPSTPPSTTPSPDSTPTTRLNPDHPERDANHPDRDPEPLRPGRRRRRRPPSPSPTTKPSATTGASSSATRDDSAKATAAPTRTLKSSPAATATKTPTKAPSPSATQTRAIVKSSPKATPATQRPQGHPQAHREGHGDSSRRHPSARSRRSPHPPHGTTTSTNAKRRQDGVAHHAGQPLRRGRACAGEQRTRARGTVDRERLDNGRERPRRHDPAAGDAGERRGARLQLRLRQRRRDILVRPGRGRRASPPHGNSRRSSPSPSPRRPSRR